MDMKRFFLYAIVIAALALAGCGGNGGTQTVTPEPPPPPDPCPAGQERNADGDCVTPTPPPPMIDHDAVIAAIVNPSTAGDPTTATPTTNANRPGNADDETFMARQGASATGTTAALLIEADELDKDDMTGTPPMSVANQFMRQEGSETMLGAYDGSVHAKTVKKVTDTVTVFTNREEPGELAYDDYYAVADRGGVTGTASTTPATLGQLTIDVDAADVAANAAKFVAAEFPTGDRQTFVYPGDDTNTPQDESVARTFPGSFNGVQGSYSCTGATCSASTDKDGNLSDLVGTWVFNPGASDLSTVMIPGVDHDTDYLAFGYWVRETEKDDGSIDYGVGTFFDGSDDFTAAITTLNGSAKYAGKAAGMYGRKTLDSQGGVVSATSGEFTADANLTAYFGQVNNAAGEGTIAGNLLNTVRGTITNFEDGGENLNWTLMLDAIDIESAFPGFTGGTTTGTSPTKGDWAGSFYGNPTASAGTTKDYPTGVAGEFTGHFINGHVIGAFGAKR